MTRVPLPPMAGYVIGVTGDRRAVEQLELLGRKGAETLYGPTIRTHPLAHENELADATRALIDRPPDLTLLSTGIGVRGWFESAEALDLADALLDALTDSTVLVRGMKAHGAAVTAGLDVAWQTPEGTSAEMIAELHRRGVADLRVAVQLDGGGARELVDAVTALGADVVPVPVYRWTMPDDTGPARRLINAVCQRRVDAVTFTSRPQVENLCALADGEGQLDELTRALAGTVLPVCVGPVCASAALDAGFAAPLVPPRYRLGSMVMTLADELGNRGTELELGGVAVRLQGRLVAVGDDVVTLTDRESETLHALAQRVGAVLSKQQLLEDVWRGRETDEHVVEVTVARLRKALGPAGTGVETVHRRGYRLAA